jgi:tRNA nucleotidyltransferase (CCA-adding enzyme)
MTDKEYLEKTLQGQNLGDDSKELKELQKRREDVETVLRDGFPNSSPTIKYGGSRAKGTLIKEAYDLDLVCYFPSDDAAAGDTLEDIYNNAADILTDAGYDVRRKRSALRLRDAQKVDFHIDVVPGRFTDDTKTDCFLHQEEGDQSRLKTNLKVHIDHVRGSGVLDAIRLLKLWKVRKALGVKQFVFELLIIKVLKGTSQSLPDQVKDVWTKMADADETMTVEDPANPSGNDLSSILAASWSELQTASASALRTLDASGWEGIFGKLPSTSDESASKLRSAAVSVGAPSRPWASLGSES